MRFPTAYCVLMKANMLKPAAYNNNSCKYDFIKISAFCMSKSQSSTSKEAILSRGIIHYTTLQHITPLFEIETKITLHFTTLPSLAYTGYAFYCFVYQR